MFIIIKEAMQNNLVVLIDQKDIPISTSNKKFIV